MKADLATTIIAAVIGVVGGYFLVSLILPKTEPVSFKTVNSNMSYSLAEPDPEIFNYRALNPTVEVYVGDCQTYNANGECIDDLTGLEIDEGAAIELEEAANGE